MWAAIRRFTLFPLGSLLAACSGSADPSLDAAHDGGAGNSGGAFAPTEQDSPADAGAVVDANQPPATETATAARCDSTKDFGASRVVPGLPSDAEGLSLTADELTAYFVRGYTASSWPTFYSATRSSRSAAFSSVQPITELNSFEAAKRGLVAPPRRISVSPDGLHIVFDGIYSASRARFSDPFGAPVPLSVFARTSIADYFDPDSPDEKTIAVTRIDLTDRNLYWSIKSSAPIPIPGLNHPAGRNDRSPVLSADGLTLIFASDRDAPDQVYRMWIATRSSTSAPFGAPATLNLTTGTWDLPDWLSPDGCNLYFSGSWAAERRWRVGLLPRNERRLRRRAARGLTRRFSQWGIY
jgi:hypothetical protein